MKNYEKKHASHTKLLCHFPRAAPLCQPLQRPATRRPQRSPRRVDADAAEAAQHAVEAAELVVYLLRGTS